MSTKKLLRTACAVLALVSFFIYVSFRTGAVNNATNDEGHTMWRQYGGGADQSKYFEWLADHKGKCKAVASGLGLSNYGFLFNFFSRSLSIPLCT